jgi:hypothetical protein
MDEAGVAGLALLETAGIAAAAVGHASARIGDARSLWETGTLGVVNDAAAAAGLASGMRVRAACERFRAAQQKT